MSAKYSSTDNVKNKDYCNFCFDVVPNGDGCNFQCRLCPDPSAGSYKKTYRNVGGSGYNTNLMSHLNNYHGNTNIENNYQQVYKEGMKKRQLKSGPMDKYVSAKAQKIFGWIDLIVGKCLPFSTVEDEYFLKYLNLHRLSVDTLMKYMYLIGEDIQKKIKKNISGGVKFGMQLDGWDVGGGTHFCGLFIVFTTGEEYLLAMSPLFDETNFTAENYRDFIVGTLVDNGADLTQLLFISGDNVNTNKKLAELLSTYLVGCSSHRLNLAVKNRLLKYEDLLEKVNTLMSKLSEAKNHGLLLQKTKLNPVKRNTTRWSSAKNMIERHLEFVDKGIYDNAEEYFNELEQSVLQRRENTKLRTFFTDELCNIDSITLALQGDGVNSDKPNLLW